MSQLVHVITPTGHRWERAFSDRATPEYILGALASIKHTFGHNRSKRRKDPLRPELPEQWFSDESSGFVFDHPQTRVVVLKTEIVDGVSTVVLDDKGNPVELNVIRGGTPAPPQPKV